MHDLVTIKGIALRAQEPIHRSAKLRRIFFIRPLVDKLRSEDPPQVTYRLTPKRGLYRVFSGGWRRPKDEGVVIKFFSFETVESFKLTDKDAQLAGVETREELLSAFTRWYGGIPERMYRNWLHVVEVF